MDKVLFFVYSFSVQQSGPIHFIRNICRHEKRLWFVTLMLGTCMLYSTRTSMPLVETVGGKPPMDNKLLKINTNIDKYILYFKKLLPAVAKELNWSKTESGTVLSSFFWGYTVTQV